MPRLPKHHISPVNQFSAQEIKKQRTGFELSQQAYADVFGVSVRTVEAWESGRNIPDGPAQRLMYMLKVSPDKIRLFVKEREISMRLFYYNLDQLCTVIDVDESNKKIIIENFTDDLLHRAFGCNLNPAYDDYLRFLESRCFPRSRDKMKLILRDMDLPFYDPLAIIEKTEGRMAEDNQWIRIERNLNQ